MGVTLSTGRWSWEREVHSLLTGQADPLPFDTSLRPEESDPGQTGVPLLNAEVVPRVVPSPGVSEC
jgi:hypothetical protein